MHESGIHLYYRIPDASFRGPTFGVWNGYAHAGGLEKQQLSGDAYKAQIKSCSPDVYQEIFVADKVTRPAARASVILCDYDT